MTVQDLLDLAEELRWESEKNPEILDKEVRYASQPSWPLEYSVQFDPFDLIETDEAVYLSEGHQIGYLQSEVVEKLDW